MIKNIVFIIIASNLLALDAYFVYKEFYGSVEQPESLRTFANKEGIGEAVVEDTCGDDCEEYIDARLTELNARTEVAPTVLPQKPASVGTQKKTTSVSYIPIPGSGSTLVTDWTGISGTDFYMSKNDYPGLIGIYLEVNMRLANGNGTAFVRLYDATHGIGVVGSEVKTSNQTSSFVSSGNLSLWDGYNHYLIQAKSLTADTAVYEAGKLKIITEN